MRVGMWVDGREIWFSTADAPLDTSAEAFATAMLVPAMHAGRPLTVDQPTCATWTRHLQPLASAYRTLWYPDAAPPHAIPQVKPTGEDASMMPRLPLAPLTALCFSGGVDAFHTLLAGTTTPDMLVYVAGYDVKLRDHARLTAVEGLLRRVAAATGQRAVMVATNLRQHPLVRQTPWLREFGAALAAVGHMLAPQVRRMLISSDGLGFTHPEVGSRPDTDPLFSSATLAVEHVAASNTRLEKIRHIGGDPLVRQHLRVCWQNVAGQANCGRCEKCVRTMLALDACGHLGHYRSFRQGTGLVDAIDGLPSVDHVVLPFYRDLLAAGLPTRAAAAVWRLIDRSDRSASAAVMPRSAATRQVSPAPASSSPPTTPRHRLLGPDAFARVFEPLVGRRVGYVRPLGNVGDHLIELAMAQLLAAYGIRWTLVDLDRLATYASVDLLAFGGGGNMGTRYTSNYALRGQALATGLPVVILPQSFTSPEDRPFAWVSVRERTSLSLYAGGILAPDLALGLAWPAPPRPDRDLGVLLRRDQERGGRKPWLARDPVRLASTPADYLALAARYRRIVTDRLHFAVAGLHAGRDVTLVANDYHKNRSMHETWLADLGCRFAATADDALAPRRRAA